MAQAAPEPAAATRRSGQNGEAAAPSPTVLDRRGQGSTQTFGVAAFEYVDRLQSINDPALIQEAFANALAGLGVTNFALLEFSPDPNAFGDSVIDERMPTEWKQRYFTQRYVERDPVITEVMTNVEPFLWSEALEKAGADKSQQRIFHEASEFRLNEGMCIPIYGPRRYMAWVTLAGAQLDQAPGSRAALHVMALYTHNRLVKLQRATTPSAPDLTQRETECLRWVAKGKSDWEIGEILSISERTAHWYIENAKRKLGVATRLQAVISAVTAGLIAI
jgi:LuxR family transcriptional regulator, quorum-sensing system regulator BjaR1